MSDSNTNSIFQILKSDLEAGACPVIVTISDDDSDLRIAFRILNWGDYYYISPEKAWWEPSGNVIEISAVEKDSLEIGYFVAAKAISDLLVEKIEAGEIEQEDLLN